MGYSLDLVTIDKSWIDITLRTPRLPAHDEKVVGELLSRQPGGMGGNVACSASRLGLRVGMVSWVGDDADGQLARDDLRRFGVDDSFLLVEPGAPANYAIVVLDPSGEKAIIIAPASFNRLNLDDAMIAYLSGARIVYTTAYDLEQVAQVAAVAHRAGGLVAADVEATADPPAGANDLPPLVDLLFAPAAVFHGVNLRAAAQELVAAGPRVAVIMAGADGAVAATREETVVCPAFSVPVKDTTGAGDCFTGAFLTAYRRGMSLRPALMYAQAAAALSIQAYGARGALPIAKQVQEFLEAHRQTL